MADSIYKPAPSYKPTPAPQYKKPVYEFEYEVIDKYAGLEYAHTEARDGYVTDGGYSVVLPGNSNSIFVTQIFQMLSRNDLRTCITIFRGINFCQDHIICVCGKKYLRN